MILTEEELSSYERELKNSVRHKAMYESDHILIEEIIESHRALFVANAELSFKNMMLKEALTDISTHIGDIASKDFYYDAYLEVKMSAYKSLEEVN